MENDLQKFLRIAKGNEVYYMNQLHGVISDNCVTAADVHPTDAKRAVVRITGKTLEQFEKWQQNKQPSVMKGKK